MKHLALAALLLASLTACGDDDPKATDTTLTVLAASSLTGTFTELKSQFEDDHAGVEVSLAFDSSTTLATQVVDGAPGDVLATADEKSMDLAKARAEDPVEFATNTMVLVVPKANDAGIETFADLAKKGVDWVMCDPSAPCGALAQTNLDENRITGEPASLEIDVKSVLAKVVSDEADAGLVYATDATAAGDAVQVIEIPHADEYRNEYYIATITNNTLAQEWVDLVTGSGGQAVLTEAGFGTP